MQFFAVLSYRVDPSFSLVFPLPSSMCAAVVCYLEVFVILHPIQVSKVSLDLYFVNYLPTKIRVPFYFLRKPDFSNLALWHRL